MAGKSYNFAAFEPKNDFLGTAALKSTQTPKQLQMYSNKEKRLLSTKKLPLLTSYKFPVGGSKKMATFLLSKLDSLVNLRKLDLSGSSSWRPNKHGPLLV